MSPPSSGHRLHLSDRCLALFLLQAAVVSSPSFDIDLDPRPTGLKQGAWWIVAALLGVALMSGAVLVATDVSMEEPLGDLPATSASPLDEQLLVRIGVVPRYDPVTLYGGHQPIIDYLTESTPFHFELRPSPSYEAAVDQLLQGDLDAAFVGAYSYARARQRGLPLTALLASRDARGSHTTRAVLFTRGQPSTGAEPTDLTGRKIALPSPNAFSGVWPLVQMQIGRGPFAGSPLSVHHFKHHDAVMLQVLRGRSDLGVVRERLATRYQGQITILARSEPIPASPLVIRGDRHSPLAEALTSALLAVDPSQPRFDTLVSSWDDDYQGGFAEIDDSAFAPIQALIALREGR